MKIKIVNFKKHESGKLRGFVDVQILDVGLTIQGAKFFRNDKGEWLSLPDKEYTNKEGDRKWQSFLKFTPDKDKEFQDDVKIALVKYLDGAQQETQRPQSTPDPSADVEPKSIPF